MCHFRAQNVHSSWTIFFGTNHYYYFHLSLLLLSSPTFSLHKIKKKFLQWIQSYVDAPFLGPKWSICHKQIFFWKKIINILFIYQQVPFIKQNFQKSFAVDPELWGCTIFGPKMVHFPKWEFFFSENLLMSLVSFIHAYLNAKNQSQILIY